MTISVKFLVFTLGAIVAIAEAHLRIGVAASVFVLFVVLAQILPVTILILAASSSRQSKTILERFSSWLQHNSRVMTIVFGVVFGTWFLLKALRQLGVV